MGEVDQPLSEEIDSPTHLTDGIDTATEYFLHQTECKTFCPPGQNSNTSCFHSNTPKFDRNTQFASLPDQIYQSHTQDQKDKRREFNLKMNANKPQQVCTHDFNPLDESTPEAITPLKWRKTLLNY